MRIIGYGICGPNEKRLKGTLDEFTRLTDRFIICGNNIDKDSADLIRGCGGLLVEDNREWGKYQNKIKEDFVRNHVSKLNPDCTICLDMDERFSEYVSRETIEALSEIGGGWYVYIVNLWNDGWQKDWSFWNIRLWFWDRREELGDEFFNFYNRPLHCGLSPAWTYYTGNHAPLLLLHYGLKDKGARERKIERYKKYDPNQKYRSPQYYSALKSDKSEPFDEKKIYNEVKQWVDTLKQHKKQLRMKEPEEVVYLLREADGVILPIPKKAAEATLKRGGFKMQGEETIGITPTASAGQVQNTPVVDDPLECKICGHIKQTTKERHVHAARNIKKS